jgi:HSP20 family protein
MTTNTALRWIGTRSDLVSAPNSLEHLYDQLFGYPTVSEGDGTPTYTLPVDILETEDAYELYASAAGVREDAVEVTFDNGMLSVTLKAGPFEGKGKFIRQERPWGNWSRKLELPKEVDPANIVAEFANGSVMVRIPKAAKSEPQRIAIGAVAPAGANEG